MAFNRILIFFIMVLLWESKATAQAILGKTEAGKASYYSSRFDGRKTSFGEVHKSSELTAAHRKYPFNTMLEITNPENQEKVIVRVNDRGPYSKSRLVDISKEAARLLGIVAKGVAHVTVRVVGMEGMVLLGKDEDVDLTTGKIISMKREN